MSDDPVSDIEDIIEEELSEIGDDSGISGRERYRERLLGMLQDAAKEIGKSPSRQEFDSLDTETSAKTIAREFSTWNEAKEAAGLRQISQGGGWSSIGREEMINKLQDAADELGESPTVRQFNSLDNEISTHPIKNEFGTWNEAKKVAGLQHSCRGRNNRLNINESYFESVDTPEKAYWLGTLIACSSVRKTSGSGSYALYLGRSGAKSYFVTEFSEAIDSDHSINYTEQNKTDKRMAQIGITNTIFVDHLLDTGYSTPDERLGDFPVVDSEYRAAFLRGFLESSGYFSTGGWNVTVENTQRAETLQEWFEEYGAKRATITEKSDQYVVRVSNTLDIRSVFESVWPDALATEPSWEPYPQKIIDHLQAEYPYPENVPYLDSPTNNEALDNGRPSADQGSQPAADDGEYDSDDGRITFSLSEGPPGDE